MSKSTQVTAEDIEASLPSAVEDYSRLSGFNVGLDQPLPFDPQDDAPEPVHPPMLWVLCDSVDVPKNGHDYATPAEMLRRTQARKVNDVVPRPTLQQAQSAAGVIRLEFATREEFLAFVEDNARNVGPRVYMKVAEYATYRGVAKGTIEARIREGMPLEGRSKHRRVHVERADEWFRNNPLQDVRGKAKAAALRKVADQQGKP